MEKMPRRERDLPVPVVTETTVDTFVDVTLQYGKTYSVSVVAVNSQGHSSSSSLLSQDFHIQPLSGDYYAQGIAKFCSVVASILFCEKV